jgi:hypothetical protein
MSRPVSNPAVDRSELRRLIRGESRRVLLAGAAQNWLGAVKIAGEVWPARSGETRSDHAQMKAFTAGTAATFGSYYLYLYVAKKPAVPWLVFGAALKLWAFLLSAILLVQGRLGRAEFITFGVSNGLVGSLMWRHIATVASRQAKKQLDGC